MNRKNYLLCSLLSFILGACGTVSDTTQVATCATSPTSLLSWWNGDHATSSIAFDLFGSRNGTLTGINTSKATLNTKSPTYGFSTGYGSALDISNLSSANFTNQISVNTWVYANNYNTLQGQSLVSKGQRTNGLLNIKSFDTTTISPTGMPAAASGYGGISDGRYIYMTQTTGANLARYDTHSTFTSNTSWQLVNLNALSATLTPEFFDGRYVYFRGATARQVLQFDTTQSFTASAWTSISLSFLPGNLSVPVSDGRYYYFFYTPLGLMRYDSQASGGIAASTSWSTNSEGTASSFAGMVSDGRYIYIAQKVLPAVFRFDTSQTFATGTWTSYNTNPDVQPYADLGFFGGIFDGRYVYFGTSNNSALTAALFARLDTTTSFTSASSWSVIHPNTLTGLGAITWSNSRGSAFDGRYIYYLPWSNNAGSFPFVVRYDTSLAYSDTNSWNTLTTLTGGVGNFAVGGVFDGRYVYTPPWNAGSLSYQFDTSAGQTMSFDLRVNNSSFDGLQNASFMGPSFIVNTANGGFQATASTPLSPATWHHIVGTYDGTNVQLYVDGVVAATTPATGNIIATSNNVRIGTMETSKAAFNGQINDIQIYSQALSASTVQSMYNYALCRQ